VSAAKRYANSENWPRSCRDVSATARGGPVEPEVYQGLKREFLEGLRSALPLDGLYLDMHGAMNVHGMDDAEGDWIASARQVLGPGYLISASYDLHGNVSKSVMENLDILTAFRTAPHIDVLETRERAFNLLLRCLRENVRPERAWLRVPVLLPGERTSTEWETASAPPARGWNTRRIRENASPECAASHWS
jgi:microcystin degradation protein MlrC